MTEQLLNVPISGKIAGILGNPARPAWYRVISPRGTLTLCGLPDGEQPAWHGTLKPGDPVVYLRTNFAHSRPGQFVGQVLRPEPIETVPAKEHCTRDKAKPLADRRPRGEQDDALVALLELAARDRGVKVCELVNELLWQAVHEGKVR
jgi:hypothetical protein